MGGHAGHRGALQRLQRARPSDCRRACHDGDMLRWLTAGESHGPALTGGARGMPADVAVTTDDVAAALARRRLGYGRGARQKFEADAVELSRRYPARTHTRRPHRDSGGQPEWPKWQQVMAADPVDAEVLAKQARNAPLTRPGPVTRTSSVCRSTASTTPGRFWNAPAPARLPRGCTLGALAKALLDQAAGVKVFSHVVRIGSVASDAPPPSSADLAAIDADLVRGARYPRSVRRWSRRSTPPSPTLTPSAGGEVIAEGLPPGLGSYVHPDRRLTPDSRAALMGIQAIKGVEVGDGFALAAMRGSRRRTRSCWSMARSPGPPGTVVAPKAGCRPASPCACVPP